MLDRWLFGFQYRPIERRLMDIDNLSSIEKTAEGLLPTETGLWNIVSYREKQTNEEHVALYKGNISSNEPLLTRLHSSCLTAETFHATNCDCHQQMEAAMKKIAGEGRGVIVWLHQEGRGNGLAGKVLQLREMMEKGVDTVTAFENQGMKGENRSYQAAIDIYRNLGVCPSLRLLTHNPGKIQALRDAGFSITLEPFVVEINSDITARDLQAKKEKLNHLY